jgi:acyl-CoA synthetase (AMP-forming)/AMP-acid ligase II
VEVEGVLIRMPAIADVAVVGKKDQVFGETVAAFVVVREGEQVSQEDIRQFCADKLANYKIPSEIILIDKIPRTPTGKILKRELRERLR